MCQILSKKKDSLPNSHPEDSKLPKEKRGNKFYSSFNNILTCL